LNATAEKAIETHREMAPQSNRKGSPANQNTTEATNTAPRQTKRFLKPTIEELKLAVAKAGMPEIEATKFFNHHESKGWMIGKSPMRSWTAAMGTWKLNYDERRNGYQHSHRSHSHAPAPGERFISRSDAGDEQWESAAAIHRSRNLDGPPDDRALPGILGADPETQPGAPS